MKKTIYSLFYLFILSSGFAAIKANAQQGSYLNVAGNNGYVEMYNASSLYSLSTGTVSFWFKINDLTTATTLFSTSNKGTSGVNNNEFYVCFRKDYKALQIVGVKNGSVKLDVYTSDNTVNDNNWHHVAVVADGVGNQEVYLDGTATTTIVGTCCGGTAGDFFFASAGTLNNMKIGSLERGSNLAGGSFQMDDLKIWGIALTSCQVTESLTNPSIPQTKGLKLYYNFEGLYDNSIGTTGTNDLKDVSGNNIQGDVITATLGGTAATAYVPQVPLTINSNKYVEIYNASSLYTLSSGTISFWFQVSDLDVPATFFSASNKGTANVNNNEFYICYRKDYKAIQVVGVNDGSVELDAYTPTNSVNDNNWHSFSVVSDGAGDIQIFLDGSAVTLRAGTCCGGDLSDFFLSAAGTLNNMKLGTLERGTNLTQGNFLMDDFRISGTSCTKELLYEFTLLEDLTVGIAGSNDYREINGNNYHGDFINPLSTATLSYSEVAGISVFPNPANNGSFTVVLPPNERFDLALYNSAGLLIRKVSNVETNYFFSDPILSSGIYNLQITGKGVKSNVKLQVN